SPSPSCLCPSTPSCLRFVPPCLRASPPSLRHSLLHRLPPLYRIRQHRLVRVLQLAARRQAAGQPRDLHAPRPQLIGQIQRRPVPLHRRVQPQNHFADRHTPGIRSRQINPPKQIRHRQVLGPDPVQRREVPHQHVVHPPVHPRMLQGDHVL